MANVEELKDENLGAAAGGAFNTNDWTAAHWQAPYPMGTEFVYMGYVWYRVKIGDFLGSIAQKYNTTPAQLQKNNPLTIKNINEIYAGDALIIRKA